jgi:hypothetical protein
MNYELAKKLKDAGFPLEEIESGTFMGKSSRLFFYYNIGGTAYYEPTLSELINACGDGLINLWNFNGFWGTNFKFGISGETVGDTPEEAVANLWLKLNEEELKK